MSQNSSPQSNVQPKSAEEEKDEVIGNYINCVS
jgi:hypothetical protein